MILRVCIQCFEGERDIVLAFSFSFIQGIHKAGVMWFAITHVLSVDTHLKGVFIFSLMHTEIINLANNTVVTLKADVAYCDWS